MHCRPSGKRALSSLSWRIFHTPCSKLIQQLSAVAPEPEAPLEPLYEGPSAVHGHTSALAPEPGAPLEALPGGSAICRCTVASEPKNVSQCTSTSDSKVKSGALNSKPQATLSPWSNCEGYQAARRPVASRFSQWSKCHLTAAIARRRG